MKKITIGDMTIGEGLPKICAPLIGRTKEQLMKQCRDIRHSKADLAEWRVDFFNEVLELDELNDILQDLKEELGSVPLLFTFRTAKEGGEKEIEIQNYIKLNKMAIQSQLVDLIDIELFRGDKVASELINFAEEYNVHTIISNHDFEQTPRKEEILTRLKKGVELGADIPKIAVMPQSEKDVLTLLEATIEMKKSNQAQPIITISMGDFGLLSRISGDLFGSAVTFGTVGQASAPGQISVDSLYKCLQVLHNGR